MNDKRATLVNLQEREGIIPSHLLTFVLLFLLCACPAYADGSIRLLFGGDVTMSDAYPEIAPLGDVPDPCQWPFARLMPLIDQHDVFMVNLENAVTKRPDSERADKKFTFKMDPALLCSLKSGRVQVVTIANNHVFDYGAKGLADTLKAIDAQGIGRVGAGMDLQEARRPWITEVGGKKIGFLGYGNYSRAGVKTPGVVYRVPEYIEQDVKKLKAQVDYVVVNFHWGVERMPQPQDEDRALAYLAIDSGADVVVGHHPHVLQPLEFYKGKPIAFSLGNFIFGGNSHGPKDAALMSVEITEGAVSARLVPIKICPQETKFQPYVVEEVCCAGQVE